MRKRFLLLGAVALLPAACDSGPGAPQKGLEIVGEPRVVADPNLFRVDGRIRNVATRPYTGQVKVTLFDEAGKIVGVFVGAVNDVPPGEEATYTALGTDRPEKWARVQARVELQIPR